MSTKRARDFPVVCLGGSAGGLKPWTDDYSDILGPFLSKMKLRAE